MELENNLGRYSRQILRQLRLFTSVGSLRFAKSWESQHSTSVRASHFEKGKEYESSSKMSMSKSITQLLMNITKSAGI